MRSHLMQLFNFALSFRRALVRKRGAMPRSGSRSGFALVVVLAVLLLLATLVVGFLTSAMTERAAASSFQAASATRQLADTVVGVVQGQINVATSQSDQGSLVAWASQPGMVRTFTADGELLNAYKLYSADNMISYSISLTDDTPATAGWAASPAVWTDLNAPANGIYPILDPNANATGFVNSAGTHVASYGGANTMPMPVRWLYLLRDGTLAAASSSSGTTATVPGETGDNPIVGRIAFWTDDETCKININTASEGTYWDTPKGNTYTERSMANFQPAQREYQRYPGHPAMTSLSAVFPSLTAEQIYQLSPRVVGETGTNVGKTSKAGTAIASGASIPDSDRLYSSVDELVFNPNRTVNSAGLDKEQLERARFFLTAHSRAPEVTLFNLPRIACWPVYRGLATAKVTAFDKLIAFCASTGDPTATPASPLLPYYFQRELAGSPTNDISIARNIQLYSYLRYLTSQPVPGFGGDFKSKYGDDRDQILTEIFDYIRSTNLFDDLIPNASPYTEANNNRFTKLFVSASTSSMAAGHGWVAPIHYQAPGGPVTMGFGRGASLSEFGIGFICNADGNDTTYGSNIPPASATLPANANKVFAIGETKLSTNQKYIQAIIVLELFSPMFGWTGLCPDMQVEITGMDQWKVNGTSLGLPGDSYVAYIADVSNQNGGRGWGGNIGWRYFNLGKNSPARGNLAADTPASSSYPFIGIPVKILVPVGGTMAFSGQGAGGSADCVVKIYAGATPLGSPAASSLIQTLNISLPAGTFPVPNLVTTGIADTYNAPITTTAKENWWAYSKTGCVTGFPGRLNYTSNAEFANSGGTLIGNGAFFRGDGSYDVVRTVLPAHGDYRLVAARNNVPASVFQPHPRYTDSTRMIAASLTNSGGANGYMGYDTRGKYISSLTYPAGLQPDIAYGAPQTPETSGDYDTSLPRGMDGPFINKPDEGNTNNIAAAVPYYGAANYQGTPDPKFFSPNRIMPSPGMFGSLPTGVLAGNPWQTLLFRPQSGHPGSSATIPDHLLMDLFWMPVVEPYAISDRFSTAGKVNMNYQIIPFTYITRNTALRALLKSEKVAAIRNSDIGNSTNTIGYRAYGPAATPPPKTDSSYASDFRLAIDQDQTLSQFQSRFDSLKIFRSATEICDLHIVPTSQTVAGMPAFWKSCALTGDNMRERIYTTLYPRLTTKSNTYTVHFRVQSLKKAIASAPGTWTEGKDVVAGEYRGSTTLERFIDANNPNIPDYAADPTAISGMNALDKFYRWRVVANHQFAP
ncbi:MAG: Verru_Chthon cassette protein A [Candidatus Methylacidiphilales bacterium]|nr:Verru_Chthon cassette protein A [Candidatus Methylacidiphilales bacterium]